MSCRTAYESLLFDMRLSKSAMVIEILHETQEVVGKSWFVADFDGLMICTPKFRYANISLPRPDDHRVFVMRNANMLAFVLTAMSLMKRRRQRKAERVASICVTGHPVSVLGNTVPASNDVKMDRYMYAIDLLYHLTQNTSALKSKRSATAIEA